MKRFLVFYGTYPGSGGWNDFFKSFDSLDEARQKVAWIKANYPKEIEWSHIIDTRPAKRSDDWNYVEGEDRNGIAVA